MQLSLGTGLALGRLRRTAPRPGIPTLLRPPSLTGTGRIGAALGVDPGEWSGAERLAFVWLKDAAPIPGATGRNYAPGAADDRTALACRVTAVGAGGRTAAETLPITIAFPQPRLVGPLPDLDYAQGTGPHIMDVSPFFSGSSLSFTVTGPGVAVDPATGLVTVSAAALLSGVSVLVTAANSGGAAETRFRLTVGAAPAAVPPVLIAAPTLAGSARVGEPLAVEPGSWAGDPVPDLALQWLSNGTPVEGATDDRFTPDAAQDGAVVACRVTASNPAGSATAETGPVTVTRTPPTAVGALADVVLALRSGGRSLPAAGAFAGEALRFSVAGAGAGVDPGTGVVAIPAGTPRAGETVTVTATNSGGAATQRFAVTVLAAPAALAAPAPVALAQGPGSRTIAAAAFFSGSDLAFALEAAPAGVTIGAASGLITVPTAAALAATLTVRATNLAGAATQRVAVTVLAAPAALAAPAPVALAQGPGSRTIAAAAFFSGSDLAFALEAAPAGVTIGAASGLITVPTAAALAATLTVRATNLAGAATQRVAVSVRASVAPLTNAAPPTFTPRVAPGTTVGSVWDIGDGTWAGGLAPFTTERSVFRGATQTVPYGAAASYAILAADRGAVANTLTARVRRTDSSVPPQVVTVTATGSAVIPPVVTGGGADYTVSNTAQLLAAMIASTASTAARTIRCLPGDYAGLNRGAALTKPGARTTVIAANRNQGGAARTRFLNVLSDMARLSGFTFDGLVFESTAKDALGYPHADSKAINWTDAANITLRNCTFKGHHRCVAIHRSDNLTVEWNEFTRIGMDSLSCFDTHTNLKIHNNHFHDLDVDASRATSDAPNRHPDGASCQGTSSRNIEWIGNSFFGPNAYWQGIFCANSTIVGGGDFNANAHDGVTIRKNWIVSRHSNGLFIAGARGVVCEDNVLRTLNTAPARPWASDTPKLVLATRVEGIVRRNVMPGGIAYRFNPPLAAILQRDTNVISTTATPANLPVPEPCGPYGYE